MRQSLKISVSLLIALLAFGAFAVVSFTGFFDLLETVFFQPRITREREADLERYAAAIVAYHRANIERFSDAARQGFVASAFRANQNQEDIFTRENYFGRLLEDLPYLQAVRIIGADGKKIHYSTVGADLAASGPTQRKYHDLPDVDDSIGPEDLQSRDESPRLVIDAANGRFAYLFRVSSAAGEGTILFYVVKTQLSDELLSRPDLDFRGLFLMDRLGVVVNPPVRSEELVSDAVVPLWRQEPEAPAAETVILSSAEGEEAKFSILSRQADGFGYVSLMLPFSAFELQPLMKGILLAAVFLTVFLILFLAFNLRQDPTLVLAQRIKRFQLEVLQELIEGKERVEWQRWHNELVAGRSELKSRIKRGVGRIPAEREQELDGMIDKSWDEIITVIEAKLGPAREERVDLRGIEEMIQKALDRGQIRVAAQVAAPAEAPVRAPAAPPALAQPGWSAGTVVEEIGVDEVVELAAGGGEGPGEEVAAETSVEQAEEAEEAEEVEEIEALEEVEEAEAVEERVEEPAAAPLAEEAEEAEEVEALEEIEEAEAVEEIEALEEVEKPAAAPLVEEVVAEAEPLEEAAEAEIAEQFRAMEPMAARPVEAPPPGPEAPPGPEMPEPARAPGALEELEPVREIVPLPPLPQEVLEELPTATEEAPKRPPLRKTPTKTKQAARAAAVEKIPKTEAVGQLEERAEIAAVVEPVAAKAPHKGVPSAAAGAVSPSTPREAQQFETLVAAGKIVVYTLADIEQKIVENRTSVVMEDGVYRVKKELYSGGKAAPGKAAPGSKGLRARAESALSSQGEKPGESGIGSLFGEDILLDLEKEIEGTAGADVELLLGGRQKAKRIQFFETGLDYDRYLKGFGTRKTVTQRLKSLVELSGKLKAVNAAVFMRNEDKYQLAFKVGLLDEPGVIEFGKGEYVFDRFLARRCAVFVRERPEHLRGLSKKFNADDLRYLQAAVFVPITYEETESYLYMGLPNPKNCDLDKVIDLLDIY